MPSLSKALNSQVGRKFMTGLTGVALMLFLIVHLAGNLTLFASEGAFNAYTHKLESLGPLLYVAEAILAFLFMYHAVLGINIWLHKRRARGSRYEVYKSKGGPSHQSLASKSMIFTGIVILVFLVAHIIHFKFGAYYETTLDGETVRDLKRLVVESFSRPLDTFLYVGVLLLVILHLSHGFWSAFTSLGMKSGNTSKKMQMIAYGFAIVLMGAFMFIPLYIFFAGPDASLIAN